MYYTVAGSTTRRRVSFNAPVRDGREHLIILSATGNTATLRIDDLAPQSQALVGEVVDCGRAAANCVLMVGQRANGANQRLGITGTVSLARLYPSSLVTSLTPSATSAPPTSVGGSTTTSDSRSTTTPPQTTAPPSTTSTTTTAGSAAGFVLVNDRFMAGRNQGGSQPAGVPLAECIAQCQADPLCLSLDAGKGARAGACFLSYESRASIAPDALTASTTFDYYEKV